MVGDRGLRHRRPRGTAGEGTFTAPLGETAAISLDYTLG